MSFVVDEIVFPEDIAYGSQGGPEFSTEIIERGDGSEQRNQRWQFYRERWDISYGVRSQTQLDALQLFFIGRGGRARGFLFRNPKDYDATLSRFATGVAGQHNYQLAKTYTDGLVTYTRRITRPKLGTVHVFKNGVEQLAGITITYTTGNVNFSSAPAAGDALTATFEFYVPMRFDDDFHSVSIDDYLAGSASLPLVQVRE
jgi:uncharacterized protein (TIGR02217 family)